MTLQSDEAKRPLIIGEVLFDCFPDRSVLGGAPFNVAWNLRGLGLNPLIITAVGDDILGEQVQQRMSEWGMDLSGLQICTGKPTGQVDIQLMDGHASYQFRDDVAFDHLLFPEGLDTDDNFGLLYHGSLALRCPDTYQTVLRLRKSIDCPCFIDINIRPPHFTLTGIEELLTGADHLKLNEHELRILLNHPEENGDSFDWRMMRQMVESLAERWDIKNCWLTAGEFGAAWLGPSRQFIHIDAATVTELQDTVGAGDALSAVIICGIIAGLSPEVTLRQAVQFAAAVCGLHGAICQEPSFYNISIDI